MSAPLSTAWQLPEGLPRRWLFVTQYYLPEPGATQVRLSAIIRILRELGVEVEVFTAMPHYPTGVVPEKYRGRWTAEETIDGVPVHRTWVYGYGGKSRLRRVLNFFSYTASSLVNLFRCEKPEVVFVEALPLPVGILGVLARLIWRVPYVYNIPDMQIEVAREMGWTRNRAVLRAAEAFENFLMLRSWKVSTVTQRFIDFYHRERGIPREQLTLLCNGADTRLLRPMAPDQEMIRRFGVQGKKVFVYAGTHANYHRLDTIIEAAELLKGRDDIRILMVGQGPDRQRIIDLARQKGLTNVLFEESPFEETARLMSIAVAALVVLRNAPVATKMRLAKTFPPMACKRPVIFSGEGESAELIAAHACGIVGAPENPRQMADAMLRLADDPALARRLGENAHRYLTEELDWTSILKRWLYDLMEQEQPGREAAIGARRTA
ncbi:MAG TPA: glycosyltransferase family 4 protein [Myxococcales bacterium]|nr:glycosyltransferase family 4 protein [Myxococcales bacterium]